MRHLLFILFVLAMVPGLSAAEIRIDGLPREGVWRVEGRAVTLRGETTAARLWWSDSRGGRGEVAVQQGRFSTGELGVEPGYTGIVLTDGGTASAFVGVMADYAAEARSGDDILPAVAGAEAGKAGRERAGLAVQFAGGLWPRDPVTNTVRIPYTLSSGGGAAAAIAAFNAQFTGQIQWVPRAGESAYVDFALNAADLSRECQANVGRMGGEQKITGSMACTTAGLLHEMGHVLGLYHEHQRPDAATWVSLQRANADKPQLAANLSPQRTNAAELGLYDYASLMHYHPLSGSKNRRPVLSPVTAGIPFGEAGEFSAGDGDQIRRLYGFTPEQVTVTTHPVGLPVVVDGVTYTSPQTFNWAMGSQHTVSVPAGFQARSPNDGARYQFGGWNDGLAQSHTITVAAGTGGRTSPSNRPAVTVYQASFVRYNRVTVGVTGSGSVQFSPALTTIEGQTFAVHNTLLTATPVAGAGSRFRRWAGTDPFPQGQAPKEILVWAHPWTIQAEFTTDAAVYGVRAAFTNPAPPASPVNAAVAVQVDGATHLAPQNFSAQDGWTAGSSHTLAVNTPQTPETPNVRYVFNGWTTGSPQIASLPAAATNWVAEFTPQYRGYSTLAPACAAVAGTPPVADGFYADGLTLPFAVTAASGWLFTGWSGDITGTANPSTLGVRDQFVVTAAFNTTNVPLAVFGLSPASAVRGAASQMVTVNGAGFTPGSRVVVNNVVRTTTYLSSTQLRVTLGAADLSVVGALPVGVYNFTTSPSCGVYTETAFEVRSPEARWSITKTANGAITQGQPGLYTVTVTNAGGTATAGLVTVTELPPAGFPVLGMTGSGWNCAAGAVSCTRQDALGPGESYPPITVTLQTPVNAPLSVTNQATVSGGNVPLNATGAVTMAVRPAPASVAVSGGSGQTAAILTLFGAPLAATVRDSGGAGVSGIVVVFTAPGTGPSGTFPGGMLTATATTNASGVATVEGLRASGLAGGPYVVAATVAGVSSTASFVMTNLAGGQAIEFAPLSGQLLSAGTVTVAATASSGLAVSFAAAPAGVCSVSGAVVSLLGAGTCTVTAAQAGNVNYLPAAAVAREFLISQANQTITFAPIADRALNAGAFPVTATASSGLGVALQSLTAAVCSVSGTMVTPLGTGQCSVRASQGGGGAFTAAPEVVRSFAIVPSEQTITFASVGGQTLVNPVVLLTATASSGLPVSLQSLTPGQCSVAGATVTLAALGECRIQASQSGNAAFAPAAAVTESFLIGLASQTLTMGAIGNQVFGGAGVAVATTSSSGLAVVLTAGPAGICAMSGGVVQLLGAGSCTVVGNQPGNGVYAAAPELVRTFTIAAAAQTISFPAAGPFSLSVGSIRVMASASSGLAVTLGSDTPLVCTVAGADVSFLRAGNCQLRATQPGNANFTAAAAVTQVVVINRAAQSITFGALANQALSTGSVQVGASSTAGLAVSVASQTPAVCAVNGTTLTLGAVGLCRLEATQAGDANYLAADPVVRTFEISLGVQTITFPLIGNVTFGVAPFALSATASSGLPVSFTGSTPAVCTVAGAMVTIVGGGTCVVQANQGGNASFAQAAPVVRTFPVAQASQTISFGVLPAMQFGGAGVALTATASSGLAVSYGSLTPAVCVVVEGTLVAQAGGTCSVEARQAGDGNYLAAVAVGQTVQILPSAQTIQLTPIPGTTFSMGSTLLSATASSGLPVTYEVTTATVCRVTGATVTFLMTGTCGIRARQPGNASYQAAVAETSFAILQAGQQISFAPLAAVPWNGGPLALTATASSGLPVTFVSATPGVCVVSGQLLQLLNAGLCTVEARQAGDSNFVPTLAMQSVSIGKVSQTITFAQPTAPWTLAATASSGLVVSFASLTPTSCTVAANQVLLGSPGQCTIEATQGGNGNYAAAPTVTRSFLVTAPAQTITFQTSPPGLPLEVNGLAIMGGTSLSLTPGSYPMAAMNPAPANGVRYQFASWTHGGAQSQTITVSSAPATYVAIYTTSFLLTTTAGTGGSLSPATGYYPAGAVQVTAAPNLGFSFQGFSGALTGAANPRTLTLTGPASVQASFEQVLPPQPVELSGMAAILAGQLSGFRRDSVTSERLVDLVLVNLGAGWAENAVLQTVAVGGTVVTVNQALGHFRRGEMRRVLLRLPANATGPVVSWSGAYNGGTFSGYQSAGW
ncbi:MAG: M12 family metallopeptidase [Acidobacteriota bacterium]